MYKDKALQKKTTAERVRRYRDKPKGVTSDRRTMQLAEALIDPTKRAKLILISNALDKEVTGLVHKRENLGSLVRYGIHGFLFSEIKQVLV